MDFNRNPLISFGILVQMQVFHRAVLLTLQTFHLIRLDLKQYHFRLMIRVVSVTYILLMLLFTLNQLQTFMLSSQQDVYHLK